MPGFGRALFLDSVLELASSDEFIYHEHLVLPALLRHPNPKRVLVQGGGDGLALREVLRDPRVEQVVLVELDPMVVDACRDHLSGLHRGSFDDPRVRIEIQDIFDYLSSDPPSFDVVYVDLLDAYDDASRGLYERVIRLTRDTLCPGAIVATFGDLARPLVPAAFVHQCLRQHFPFVRVQLATIDSFNSQYAFFVTSDQARPDEDRADTLERARRLVGPIRSFDAESLPQQVAIPAYVQELLDRPVHDTSAPLSEFFQWLE